MPKRSRAKKSPEKKPESSGQSVAYDYFSNYLARTGYGTASLPEATEYTMVRLSLNYWLMVTLYRNHWIVRRIVDMPAEDMTRAWPKLNCKLTPEQIQGFDRTIQRTYTPQTLCRAIKWGRLYGGAGALIAIRGHEKFLEEPLNFDDVTPGSYMGLIPFDRWVGIQPGAEKISEDFDRPADWGLPEYYECTAPEHASNFKVHSSRILRFTGPQVPTPELQTMSYWGISEIEPIYEQLKMHDNCLWSILNLLYRANLIARKDKNLSQMLSGLGVNQQAQQRWAAAIQAQNDLLSNQSMLVLDEEGELQSVQYTFSGIGEVYQQFQMNVAGAAEIPVTRLFGRTMTGLGQTNDADERYYEEKIAKDQNFLMRPQLDKLYPVICMSEFGMVPEDLDFTFPSIRVLTEEEKGDLTEKGSAPVIAAYNAGLISQQTALKELRQTSDITGIFSNITDKDIKAADDEPMPPPGEEELGGAAKPNPNKQEKELAGGAET